MRIRGGARRGGNQFGSLDYASPVIANDKLYYVNGKGETFVFSLGPESEQLSINLVTTDSESFGGSPAISNNRLFLRSNKHLYCVADTGAKVALNASTNLIAQADNGEDEEPRGRDGGGRRGFGGGRGGRGFNLESFFNGRDANKDGKLTVDELEGNPMANRFAEIDKDGDESLSMDEFRTGLQTLFGRGGRGGRGGGFRRGGEREDNRPKRPQRPQSAS